MKAEIRVIGVDDKLPEGWEYLSSWECERLLRTSFVSFEKIEKHFYYELRNPEPAEKAWLWLSRLDSGSGIDGYGRSLYIDSRVRGVFIIKKEEVEA